MKYNLDVSNDILAEILFAINQFPYSQREKFPKDMILFLEKNSSKEHYNSLNQDKPFTKQNLNIKTIEILDDILKKYLNI